MMLYYLLGVAAKSSYRKRFS